MVDAADSKSAFARSAGSSPAARTIDFQSRFVDKALLGLHAQIVAKLWRFIVSSVNPPDVQPING